VSLVIVEDSPHRPVAPIPLPDLSHLTQAELSALRGYLTTKSREAHKDAMKMLGKDHKVRDLWLKTLGLKSDAPPEERAEVETSFYEEILRHPEAFVLYAWANGLATLDRYVWETMLERSKVAAVKPKKS
jgi:hypothetical protein